MTSEINHYGPLSLGTAWTLCGVAGVMTTWIGTVTCPACRDALQPAIRAAAAFDVDAISTIGVPWADAAADGIVLGDFRERLKAATTEAELLREAEWWDQQCPTPRPPARHAACEALADRRKVIRRSAGLSDRTRERPSRLEPDGMPR